MACAMPTSCIRQGQAPCCADLARYFWPALRSNRWPRAWPSPDTRCSWSIPSTAFQKAPTSTSQNFADPATRTALTGQMQSLSPKTVANRSAAFIPWLDEQAAVDKKKRMGTTGYCMGGPFTFRLPHSSRSALAPSRLPWCRARERCAGQSGPAGAEDEGECADRHRRQR